MRRKWNKRGLAPLFVVLVYLTVGLGSLAVSSQLAEFLFDDGEGSIADNLDLATLENSYMTSVTEQSVTNNTGYVMRMLYPKPNDAPLISVGLLIVRWDEIGNALGNDGIPINFSTAMASGNRLFFVTINSQSYAVDPLNNTHCGVERTDAGVNSSYTCAWGFTTLNKTAPGEILNEVDISSSQTNHKRLFNVVGIAPLENIQAETIDGILTYYFTMSKIVWAMFMDILEFLYASVKILLYVTGISLSILLLYAIYRWIAKPKRT